MLPTHQQLPTAVKQRNQAMNWLLTTYPKAFDLRNRRPLKQDILDDICRQAKADMPKLEALQQAYNHYTQWGSYLTAMIEGADCLDLNGDVCAKVSQEQALQAQNILHQAQKKTNNSLYK